MDDGNPQPDAAAPERQPGFLRRWMGGLKPDPGSSDPRKLGKWSGIVASAYLLIAAAAYRLIATVLHGADFAQVFIGVEVVIFVWLIIASRLLPSGTEV